MTTASIRSNSLTLGGTGEKSLGGMEKHGKRQDKTSQQRRISDKDPLVFGGLNLRELYDSHVAGCKQNKALKRPVMHAIVQFPTAIPVTASNEKTMLKWAIDFINESHGGRAVFAARLDRDEEGKHTVDVFYAPKYEKKTKTHGVQTWISNSKHGKELCNKHRVEIERRHSGTFSTGPRQVGIALQEELHGFFLKKGIKLDERSKKSSSKPDRLSPEAYKLHQQASRARALANENKQLKQALAIIHSVLDKFRDLVPTNTMNLVDKLHFRKSQPRSRQPKQQGEPGTPAPGSFSS